MNHKINSKYSGILLLIINLLICRFFCEDEQVCNGKTKDECLNINKCRYFYQSNTCEDCSSLTNANSYYTIIDSECKPISRKEERDNYLLIYGTKEVVSAIDCNSNSFYKNKLGDICYYEPPDKAEKIDQSNSEDYQYKCLSSGYFYIEEKDGFKYYKCLENYNCPLKYDYYDIDTKECTNTCVGTKKQDSIGERNILRCSQNCIQDQSNNQIEFEYTDPDNNKKYCLNQCPSNAKYYYTDNSLNSDTYKCLTKCNNEHFSKNNVCILTCNSETDKIILDLDNEVYTCTNDCPNNFPYSYIIGDKNYCLKSCQDTNKDYFNSNKKISYIFEEGTGSNLLKSCKSEKPENHFLDEIESKWVSDCKISISGPFNDGEKCKTSCEGSSCATYDSYECKNISTSTSTGEDTYYIYETNEGEDNICYKNCPDNLGRGFYHEENKTCTSCSNGFYKKDDKRCYTSCNEIDIAGTFYHNDGENFCFENGCNNNPIYKYEDPTNKICYKSCLNISNALFEKDNICYSTDPGTNTSYYTLKISSFTKYTKNLDDCFQAGQKYYKGNVCMGECNDNDYKILPTENEMGQCFNNREECTDQDYKYFNDSSKILSKKCEYFKVVDLNGELITTGNTCIDICPNNYYEDTNNKLCYTNSKYYIEDDSCKKKKVEKCDKFYHVIGEGENEQHKCVEVCRNQDNNFIYYSESGECLEKCPKDGSTTVLKFSYNTELNHQPCLDSCESDEHYYFNSESNPQICLKKCEDEYYYSNKNKTICVQNCENDEYIYPGKICSNSSCPNSAPFFVLKENNIKECVSSCKDKNMSFYNYNYETTSSTLLPNQCLDDCEGFIYNGGCYKECPDGLYIKEENSKKYCVTNCTKNFFKNSDGKYKCIEGCNSDYQFLASSGECVKKCPQSEIYIGQGNKCLSSCENDINKFYKEKIYGNGEEDPDTNYKNYLCINKCDPDSGNKFYMAGTKECIVSCADYQYNSNDGIICYKNCASNKNAGFSTENNEGEKICSDKCLNENKKNYLSDKICKEGCNTLPYNIINDFDDSCVSKCNLTSEFKFLQNNEDSSLHCKSQCSNTLSTKRYYSTNYICIEKCEPPNNYVVEDSDFEKINQCLSKCPENKPFMRKNDNGEYICSNIPCGEGASDQYSYYYMDKNICLKECDDDLYFYELDSTKYCVNSCDFFKDIKLYYLEDENDANYKKQCVLNCTVTSKQFTKMNGHCDTSCNTYEFHNDSEYICMSKCPYGTINLEEKKCTKCENLDPPQYIDENGNCIENCNKSNTGFIYHDKDKLICKDNCEGKFIEDQICKDECETKLFMNDKICLEVCPPNKRFFVDSETYSNKTCLNDCPKNFQFYKIDSAKNYYKCTNNCNAYILNYDPKMNAKICLGETCNETYPFYINDNETKKICYSECPSSTPYFIKEGENLKHCYEECPINYLHSINEFECIQYTECKESKNIKYYEKLCVDQCSKTDKIFIKGDLTFCFDNCSIIPENIKPNGANLKLTYDNKCVESCPGFSEEDDNHNCICKRLYYYNKTTGFKTCLNHDLTLCEKEKDYPILKIDTNECTTYCDGILSLSGYLCYNNSYKCEENETLTTLTNGDLKCVCLDKFYKTIENERNVTKCLKKDDACPSAFSLLIKETNECVKQCPTGYKLYGKTCVSTCPSNTKENSDNTKCECEGKWYISENYDVICTSNECPSEKKLYIQETKQCVSSCIGTEFEVYYNKTCIQSCSNIANVRQVESKYDPFLKDISKYYCKCNNIWYYDLKGYDICTDNSTSCDKIEGFNFKYLISSSLQCVDLCPDDYYKFNDECLLDCKNDLTYDDESSKMCKCKNLWKNENGKKVCLDLTSCPEGSLLIKRTNECYSGSTCPSEDPLIYDKICYEKDNCPKDLNTKYDETINKCICVNKWYKESEKEKCLGENSECPPDYPYLNSLTKECYKKQENIETDLYEYNYVYYKNCPEKTIKDENSKKCVCDPLLGYWYTTQDSNGREILKCGEEQCPEIKKYNIFEQKECIPVCPDEYQYLYQGICYQKCPDLTEVIGNTKECQLKLVDNEINLQNLEKAMTENIVDLYKKSNSFTLKNNTSVGQKIVTKNATVEFYGVNRKNKGLSNQPIKSDLSYIDISECIEKIYKSNKMKENDDIVILKFDVNKIPNKFLINPVEYKLINSRTGQELDASICEHNSIRISYPVHDLINRYDKMTRKLRTLEYMKIDLTSNNKDSLREKIDKGKEIVEEYNDTDIFNINDRIFSDICIAVEVDGKDLVLEDRINYFYPQLSLCENNCTYNHTDFPNERIYCDCSYKTEFDFEREYSPSVDLNENQVKNDQNGNSNIAVMKCISNMKYSKSLKKNGGFIYSLIIIVIEFILLLIIAFYGISVLGNKLKNKINKKEDNYEKEEIDVINSNEKENKKTEENIKTSERALNNPTKKKKDNFGLEFIPQEYLFLFFNQGEKDVIKKVERDNVPFKTKYNTRILLEQRKGVNYDNINPRGPFPPGQNLLVIVDSMDEDINDYLGIDSSADEDENKNIVNVSKNKRKNKFNQTYTSGKGSRYSHGKGEKGDFKASLKAKLYRKNFDEFSYTDYDPSDENYSVYDMEEDGDEPHEKGFIDTLKSNQRFIKRNYDKAIKNKNKNFIEILFTEIIDKIYIIKILLFTRKFDILSLHLSVYLLCHTLLLVLNTLFFDIKTIKKIWASDNYPGLGYYLGYGFLACLVVWIIYTIFLCLLTNNDKIKDILKMIHFNNKYQLNKNKLIEKKYNNLMWKVKFKFIVYSIIEYLLLALCFLYLTTFGTVYIGTQSRAFKAYGIALIEILIIKIIYGIALAIMRYISLSKEKKSLYNVVLFMDTYLV